MKNQIKIPTGKVERAAKLVGTGAKIGSNYLKYYAKKTVGLGDKEELHEENAADIYNSLSNLKGSALKVAQMLSMDKNILPKAYTQKFALAQYSVPPLSGPLVIKTFEKNMQGQKPTDIFDEFDVKSIAAASIGQVHQAKKGNTKFAVKIQYPGVADSIQSDLKLVRPIAKAMFGLPDKEMAKYFEEVEEKLLEETDYKLELARGTQITEACKELKGLIFPKYYPEYSSLRVLTMDWMEGLHLKEFLDTEPSKEIKQKIAQTLWDFYDFQLHTLLSIHADPHPGNFLLLPNGDVGVIDFGCIKEVPEDFYYLYFPLLLKEARNNTDLVNQLLRGIEILFDSDSKNLQSELTEAFLRMTELLSEPFDNNTFKFTTEYIDKIYKLGEEIYQLEEVKKPTQSRGSRHALYINRTYFGIYSIMADLDAEIVTAPGPWKQKLLRNWNLA